MKKIFLMFFVSFCFGTISFVLWIGKASAQPFPGRLPVCQANLNTCNADLGSCTTDLNACNTDLAACEAEAQVFPGDGYDNPDAFGVSGHGPALSYTDNGDGTFTDNNTGYIWEIKDNNLGVHDVDNIYNWSSNDGDLTDPDGTLFTVFLDTLNNKSDGDETTPCVTNEDCGVNGPCGFAGHRDWCIPNLKKLQSIVDYSKFDPASSVPGLTESPLAAYWSATTTFNSDFAWFVGFFFGGVDLFEKNFNTSARAVRPCS